MPAAESVLVFVKLPSSVSSVSFGGKCFGLRGPVIDDISMTLIRFRFFRIPADLAKPLAGTQPDLRETLRGLEVESLAMLRTSDQSSAEAGQLEHQASPLRKSEDSVQGPFRH
jgi:hypothetical protein